MPNTYGVVPTDVAAELPALFAAGFSPITTPTDTQVEGMITTADTIVTLRITANVGGVPSLADSAAVLAVRYIIEYCKAQITQIVYAGNDPVSVANAVKPYVDSATMIMASIDQLGAQAEGAGQPTSRTLVSAPDQTRDLLLTDADIDGCLGNRVRRF